MAKLDDFGRPIYETAEEYNRAHKGGVCPRPYDDPNGSNYKDSSAKWGKKFSTAAQNHATVAGSKKLKRTVAVVVIFFIFINVFVIGSILYSLGIMESEVTHNYHEEEWVDEGYGEYLGTGENPLPEGFSTFYFNGNEYTLPTTYNEIKELELIDSYVEEYYDMFPSDYEEVVALMDEDGYHYGDIIIMNHTEGEIPVGDCIVNYIYLFNPAQFEGLTADIAFEFADGLTFDSSYEELEAYFGTPYYVYEDYYEDGYYYDHYEWAYYGDEEMHFVTLTYCDDVILDIAIEKVNVVED